MIMKLQRLARCLFAVLVILLAPAVNAHGFRIGSIVIDHPYATPSDPAGEEGAAYFREIRNRGSQADRLLEATTEIAERVVFRHRVKGDDGWVISVIDAVELPPNTRLAMRHIDDYQLQLIGLRRPLQDGERFELELRFEHAGTRSVRVWVQRPR